MYSQSLMYRQIFSIVIWAATLSAQVVNNLPTPPPRVNPDLTVTFFLNAPNATEVRFADTVHSPGPPGIPMTKGADGMWSLTTPPYEPGTHSYAFLIDGVLTGDLFSAATAERLPRPTVLFELIDVRGSESLVTDVQAVPHGTVHIETFSSATLNRQVRVFVYTPPEFSRRERLPVVYLLHGNLADERAWTQIGYAEHIADNVIASGKAPRMIIAMPDTAGPNRNNVPGESIEPYLVDEVFPFVEDKYLARSPGGRARGSDTQRYLVGFSAGANHTRFTGLRNPLLFAGLGMFGGGGLPMGNVEDIFTLVLQPELFRHMNLIYFAIGQQDPALANVQRMSQQLQQLRLTNELNVSSGGHTWFNWRRYLAEFVGKIRNLP